MFLATILCLSLLVPQGGSEDGPEAVAVRGAVELTPGGAAASARIAAATELGSELERRGRQMCAELRPVWVPGWLAELQLRRWQRGIRPGEAMEVVAEQLQPFEHAGYRSYQSEIMVRHDPGRIAALLEALAQRLERIGARLLGWLFGLALLWGGLALVYGWLDRLTRGYMPWRLRLVFGGMGVALPGIALLLL